MSVFNEIVNQVNVEELKMNFKVFAVLIAFVLAMCAALPVEEPQQEFIGKNSVKNNQQFIYCSNTILFEILHFHEDAQVEQFVTCDIFRSNALCAIHCYMQKHKGGYCNEQKVCKCRD